MKKIGIIGLALLLLGCGNVQENHEAVEQEIITTSRIYQIEGRLTDLSPTDFYALRLAAIQQNAFEKVVLVEPAGEEASAEITITNPLELDKIAAYFNNIQLSDSVTSLGPSDEYADFEITLKGKEPLYFRIVENSFCSGYSCIEFMNPQTLNDMLSKIKGEYKKVNSMNNIDIFTAVETWADVEVIRPKNSNQESSQVIRDIWYENMDPILNVLRLSYYIHEDFNELKDITDTQLLTAGLIQQSEKYNCYNNAENVCGDVYSDNLLYFPDGMERIHNFVPDVYDIVPYNNVLQKGISIFGSHYELPSFEEGTLASQNYQLYVNFPKKLYFTYHMPYEFYRLNEPITYVLKQSTLGDEIIYTLAKAKKTYLSDETFIEGINGVTYRIENDLSDFDVIQAHADDFEQWEYVLKQEGDDVRLLSGHRINEKVYQPWQVQSDKETYYVDDTLKVNLASIDASIFNAWSANQQGLDYQFKPNIHENLLSIWVSSESLYRDFAVVFDLETGKALTTLQTAEKLGLNLDKLEKVYQSLPNYSIRELKLEDKETLCFNTTRFFINSKGKMAYEDIDGIILFEWEEAR